MKHYNTYIKLNQLKERQKDIEFTLKNKRVPIDYEWQQFINQLTGEYQGNAMEIAKHEANLKLSKSKP